MQNNRIDLTFFNRCIETLERAFSLLNEAKSGSIDYDMYRSACVKEFEIILEQSAKLVRVLLKSYFHSNQEVDRLVFKDVFRHAVLRGLITDEQCEHWLEYRDSRNMTAHDYGVHLAEETMKMLPDFIKDARALAESIQTFSNDH